MASTLLADNGVSSGSAGLKSSADSSGVLALQTTTSGGTATTAVTIDTSQNMGLGVTPSAWGTTLKPLEIGAVGTYISGRPGSNQLDLGVNNYYNAGYKYAAAGQRATQYEQFNGTHSWYYAGVSTNAGDPITFTQAMTLDASGNLLVGTTSASAFGHSYKFVTYSASDNLALFQQNTGSGYPCASFWNSTSSGDNLFTNFYVNASGAESNRGSIDYNRAGGLVRYNTSSDATLKNIIGDADGSKSIDILKSTRIREYSWKDDETNKPQIGVIAQELYETYKGAVSVGGDKVTVDADGNETTQYVPWAVDKTAFTFHLIAGWQAHERIIQEQQTIITDLTNRIQALEGAQA